MANGVNCSYCGKPLVEAAETLGYCNLRCRDKHRSEIASEKKAGAEAEYLMRQYERGGLKTEEL